MLDIIKNFVTEITNTEEPKELVHSKMQLAEAALMYHVIAVDGIIKEEERNKLAEILARHFDMDASETELLAESARDAENEAIDLYKFTNVLKFALSEEERILIIENLWEMVFADGIVHELEDNVVWRIAELLGVDSRDRMLLKQKVWKRRSQELADN